MKEAIRSVAQAERVVQVNPCEIDEVQYIPLFEC